MTPITITSIEKSVHRIRVAEPHITPKGNLPPPALSIDDEHVGFVGYELEKWNRDVDCGFIGYEAYDKYGIKDFYFIHTTRFVEGWRANWKRYPKTVTVYRITLSSLRVIEIADHPVPFYDPDALDYWKNWNNIHFQERRYAVRAKIGSLVLAAKAASKLRVGQVVGYVKEKGALHADFEQGVLTDGFLQIPIKRPYGMAEWEKQPWEVRELVKFNRQDWSWMLRTLHGLVVYEVIETEVRRRIAAAKARARASEKAQKALRQITEGQCFDGRDAKSVSVGENFIFTLTLSGGENLYVVDAPRYGAGLYVFDNYDHAFKWVSRQIDQYEARRLASAFIPHDKAKRWKDKLSEVLKAA